MNYTIYIAAAAVICLLIALVCLAIHWLRKKVTRQIRSRTVELLSLYDQLLEEKSQFLAQQVEPAQPEPEAPEQSAPAQEDGDTIRTLVGAIQGAVERSGTSVYRDSAIASTYQQIRENFSFDPQSLIPQLEELTVPDVGVATRLLEKLHYEDIYQLSTLTGQEQQQILESVLTPEELPLLQETLRVDKPFHALDFYDHLRTSAAKEAGVARLMVSRDMARQCQGLEGVQVVADEGICEGYQIEQNNLLYDFSIKLRELS